MQDSLPEEAGTHIQNVISILKHWLRYKTRLHNKVTCWTIAFGYLPFEATRDAKQFYNERLCIFYQAPNLLNQMKKHHGNGKGHLKQKKN